MPQRKNAVKRLRVDKKRRIRNIKVKDDLKKTLKQFQSLVAAKNIEEAKKCLVEISSKFDRAASKGIVSKGLANRRKSRLTIKLNKING